MKNFGSRPFRHRISAFSLAMLCALPASAGVRSGGGGGAVVCRDSNRQIVVVQMFETFELLGPRSPSQLLMSQSAKPFVLDFETQQKIDQALSHSSLSVTQRSRIQETIQILQDSAKDQVFGSAGPETPHAVRAELGLDARFKLNSKCQFAWMGYYGHSEHSENNPLLRAYGLAIDPQLYGLASTADRAAFWLHEAIYLLDRQRNEFSIYRGSKTNSRFTRRLVQSLLKISGAPVLSKNAIDRHLGN